MWRSEHDVSELLRSDESDCGQQTERCDSAGPCVLTHTGSSVMN